MKRAKNWLRLHWFACLVAVACLGWAIIVWRSGQGWNPSGTTWNFENTGQLGDSFGVLSAAMASIAAYFAFQTYRAAREDVDRLERRASEPSFLNLIERRYDVLDRVRRITIEGTNKRREWNGQEALDAGGAFLEYHMRDDPDDIHRSFDEELNNFIGLSNLFRFTYHIVSFADRQFSDSIRPKVVTKEDTAYQYIRLLRAQFSEYELILIALNCAYGEGREKFKPLVERYALLHNMNQHNINWFMQRRLFKSTAFGLTRADRRGPKARKPKRAFAAS